MLVKSKRQNAFASIMQLEYAHLGSQIRLPRLKSLAILQVEREEKSCIIFTQNGQLVIQHFLWLLIFIHSEVASGGYKSS